jgi:hypothetical protein
MIIKWRKGNAAAINRADRNSEDQSGCVLSCIRVRGEETRYFPAIAATTSNKIRGPRLTSSTRIRSSFPCSVFPSSSVAVYGLNP